MLIISGTFVLHYYFLPIYLITYLCKLPICIVYNYLYINVQFVCIQRHNYIQILVYTAILIQAPSADRFPYSSRLVYMIPDNNSRMRKDYAQFKH